jgi:hypothetical protein
MSCKAKPDLRTREDIAQYSTEHLRRLHHEETSQLIRLRDSIISRDELKAEIRRREERENWRFWIMLLVTVVGALAAIVAAIEGWRTS